MPRREPRQSLLLDATNDKSLVQPRPSSRSRSSLSFTENQNQSPMQVQKQVQERAGLHARPPTAPKPSFPGGFPAASASREQQFRDPDSAKTSIAAKISWSKIGSTSSSSSKTLRRCFQNSARRYTASVKAPSPRYNQQRKLMQMQKPYKADKIDLRDERKAALTKLLSDASTT